MEAYYFRLLVRLAASEFVPVSVRARFMCAIGFKIAKDTLIWPGANLRSRKLSTASGVFINVCLYHDGCDDLSIGTNSCLGSYVRIITGSHELGPPERRCAADRKGAVQIMNGCWIGSGVTILPGVTIADGCIIAAGAVVTKSTLRDGLYAGVPAKRVRELGS